MANELNELNAPAEANPTAPEPAADPPAKLLDEMTDGEVLRELLAFAKQFPTPEMGCNRADARWFTENFAELARLYRGQIVVVYHGAVVAHGGDSHRLRLDVARKFNVTPDCLTVNSSTTPNSEPPRAARQALDRIQRNHRSTDGGGAVRLPRPRIRAWAYFGNEGMMRQAVVDTGCPVCTLPKRIWTELNNRGDIAWVADPPATVPAGALTRTMVLLGGRYPYRLERIRLRIADLGDGQLAPREVLTLCTEDDTAGKPDSERLPLILGLAEVMNGRALLLQVSENGARWAGLVTEP